MRLSSKAFTLIELLVVLFIISMLLTFTFPRLSRVLTKLKEKQFVQQFAQVISLTATQALAFNRVNCFFIDGENRTYGLPEKIYPIPENVEIYASGLKEISPGYYHLCFFPDGTCSEAEIEIFYDGKKYVVSIHPLTSSITWSEAK